MSLIKTTLKITLSFSRQTPINAHKKSWSKIEKIRADCNYELEKTRLTVCPVLIHLTLNLSFYWFIEWRILLLNEVLDIADLSSFKIAGQIRYHLYGLSFMNFVKSQPEVWSAFLQKYEWSLVRSDSMLFIMRAHGWPGNWKYKFSNQIKKLINFFL